LHLDCIALSKKREREEREREREMVSLHAVSIFSVSLRSSNDYILNAAEWSLSSADCSLICTSWPSSASNDSEADMVFKTRCASGDLVRFKSDRSRPIAD
jgi:hypothetical protein